MENLMIGSSTISPLTAILWCLYPVGVLVLIELVLGGGFDDDNDDQDGGMLIPAYASAKQNQLAPDKYFISSTYVKLINNNFF